MNGLDFLLCLVLVVATPPNHWMIAEAAGIPKGTGKRGALGTRLINLLDPMGKVFFMAIWSWRVPGRDWSFSYGFKYKRRREAARMVMSIMRRRLLKEKINHAMISSDMANAFPGVKQDALLTAIREHVLDALLATLMCMRIACIAVVLFCHMMGIVIMLAGAGGLQGGTSMPSMFVGAYDPVVSGWHSGIQNEGQDFWVGTDPVNSTLVILMSEEPAENMAGIPVTQYCDLTTLLMTLQS